MGLGRGPQYVNTLSTASLRLWSSKYAGRPTGGVAAYLHAIGSVFTLDLLHLLLERLYPRLDRGLPGLGGRQAQERPCAADQQFSDGGALLGSALFQRLQKVRGNADVERNPRHWLRHDLPIVACSARSRLVLLRRGS